MDEIDDLGIDGQWLRAILALFLFKICHLGASKVCQKKCVFILHASFSICMSCCSFVLLGIDDKEHFMKIKCELHWLQ